MKNAKRILIGTAVTLIMLFLGYALSLNYAWHQETTLRSDQPLNRQEAEKALHRPLPSTATDIYYLFSAGGLQDTESYLRFHVDPMQADSAIQDLIAENNRIMKRTLSYPRSALPPPQPAKLESDAAGRFQPMLWWQPQTITNGYFRGEQEGHALQIWYDSDHSIVYTYEND